MTYPKDKIDKAVEEVRNGKPTMQVAEETGMSYTTVWRYVKKSGVTPKKRPIKREVKVTEREKQLFAFIVSYIEENGESPTYREMAAFFEISIERVKQLVRRMTKKGLITHKPYYARSIEVLLKKEER
jgi:transposase